MLLRGSTSPQLLLSTSSSSVNNYISLLKSLTKNHIKFPNVLIKKKRRDLNEEDGREEMNKTLEGLVGKDANRRLLFLALLIKGIVMSQGSGQTLNRIQL